MVPMIIKTMLEIQAKLGVELGWSGSGVPVYVEISRSRDKSGSA